jgi:hypothetical protein
VPAGQQHPQRRRHPAGVQAGIGPTALPAAALGLGHAGSGLSGDSAVTWAPCQRLGLKSVAACAGREAELADEGGAEQGEERGGQQVHAPAQRCQRRHAPREDGEPGRQGARGMCAVLDCREEDHIQRRGGGAGAHAGGGSRRNEQQTGELAYGGFLFNLIEGKGPWRQSMADWCVVYVVFDDVC